MTSPSRKDRLGLRRPTIPVAYTRLLLQALDGGWAARAIAVASTLCVMYTRVHALLLIAIGALLLVGVHAIGGA